MLLVIYCVIEIIVLLIDFTMTGKQRSFNLFCPFLVAEKPTGIICLICVKPILYFISCLNQAPIISYILLRAQTLKGIIESTYLTSNLQPIPAPYLIPVKYRGPPSLSSNLLHNMHAFCGHHVIYLYTRKVSKIVINIYILILYTSIQHTFFGKTHIHTLLHNYCHDYLIDISYLLYSKTHVA